MEDDLSCAWRQDLRFQYSATQMERAPEVVARVSTAELAASAGIPSELEFALKPHVLRKEVHGDK
jgi:hypothetical protein